ncbi:hypothetical protein AJ87_46485 [Rhizobium yanglingense]|nr:hypothetical protein AJ87_46485 [Rhizobium yanglingense]
MIPLFKRKLNDSALSLIEELASVALGSAAEFVAALATVLVHKGCKSSRSSAPAKETRHASLTKLRSKVRDSFDSEDNGIQDIR